MKPIAIGALSFILGAAGGAAVMASSDAAPTGAVNKAEIETIVHDYIMANPQVLVDSVQKLQQAETTRQSEEAKTEIKNAHDAIFNDAKDGHTGPANADVVVVEFFDYNCPACKMMFKGLDELAHKDKNVRIVFKELPIFGPSSEENSRVGIAVSALAPEKYFAFHEKVMGSEGRISSEQAIIFAKELGIDEAKLKDEMQKDYVNEKISANHALAEKLNVSGTPAIIVGDELIPSAMDYASLKKLVDDARKKK